MPIDGVYKSGFASTQQAYEAAVVPLFASLDRLEQLLTDKDYLVGGRLTEADVRLFVTIVRFDPVYVGHFKCNLRTIRGGYPALHRWLRTLYWTVPAFRETCDFAHIKTHYYWSHPFVSALWGAVRAAADACCRSTRTGSSRWGLCRISCPSDVHDGTTERWNMEQLVQ